MILTETVLGLLAPPPAPIPGDFNHVVGHATLQELVYFGAAWSGLSQGGYNIETRNGWQNPIEYQTDTDALTQADGFYANQVERVDSTGKITDVVLSFAGRFYDPEVTTALPAASLGLPNDFYEKGIKLYNSILHDPKYMDAKIHIAGYSMATTVVARVLAYSIVTYGETMTDQRVDFTSFAPARYHEEQARYYGLDGSIFEGRWINYQASNDENRDPNHYSTGDSFFGTEVLLPALATPTGATDVHNGSYLVTALGVPDWLTPEEQTFVYQHTSTVDPLGYTTPGMAPLRIEGDDAGTTLTGLGNDDVIIGGLGRDTMYGNGGDDHFAFETIWDSGQTKDTADRIFDFNDDDRIDLSVIDAVQSGSNWEGTNEAFKLISGSSFTAAGQIKVTVSNDTTWISVNTDTDLLPEMMIQVAGRHMLSAEDFIF